MLPPAVAVHSLAPSAARSMLSFWKQIPMGHFTGLSFLFMILLRFLVHYVASISFVAISASNYCPFYW